MLSSHVFLYLINVAKTSFVLFFFFFHCWKVIVFTAVLGNHKKVNITWSNNINCSVLAGFYKNFC